MRLTLRTMLAYMDGILEPEVAQDIKRKIDESQFAYELMHRIRDLQRRLRLAAPGVISQGPGTDPETVSQYLDNTLPPERVTEFEKLCLEADIHLAEVAACHQILTLVLGEPAEVDPNTRQKIYEIPNRFAEIPYSLAHSITHAAVTPPPLPPTYAEELGIFPERKTHGKPTVPEYLREPKKKYRWISVAGGITVAACLILVLLKTLGWFELGATPDNTTVVAKAGQENKQAAKTTNKSGATPTKTTADISVKRKPDVKAIETEAKPVAETAAPAKQAAGTAKQGAAEQPSTPAMAPGKTEMITKPAPTAKGAEAAKESSGAATVSEAGGGSAPVSALLTPTDKGSGQNAVPAPGTAQTAEKPTAAEPTEIQVAMNTSQGRPELPAAPIERLGRFMSENEILLRYASNPADCQRVAGKEFLSSQQEILALPTYRPEISLAAGVNLRVQGGTTVELLPAAGGEPAGVKLRFGRIVVMPLANPGTRLRIAFGERTGVLTFVDPEAIVAAEVRRIHQLGADPETEPARISGELFVTTGEALWEEAGQKTLQLSAPTRVILAEKLAPELVPARELPSWINNEPISYFDRRASTTIAESLQASPLERPVRLGLLELAEHRQKEVRWLAIRCLGYLDYFDPLVTLLDDSEAKNDWSDCIDQLREAVARDPAAAVAVRQALGKRYPQTASALYRMLWGYTDKDLEAGEDAKLVKYLENDSLALRVLSFWNLREITGLGLYYQPEQTSAKRQQPLQRWKQRLEAREIRVKSAEEKAGNVAGETDLKSPE
jgi:hypothetical protein